MVQVLAPWTTEILPAPQFQQELEDAIEYIPIVHAMHTVETDAPIDIDDVPALHPIQLDAPGDS